MSNENSKVLKDLLEDRFFCRFRTGENRDTFELQITPECNLGCKYCYLHNFGDKIYPKNIRNHDTILNNLDMVLSWIAENKFKFWDLALFSGEIWHTKFGLEVLNKVYNWFLKYKMSNIILIPTNATFMLFDDIKVEIEKIIKRFKNIGVRLVFSFSVDGLIIEDNVRPFKSGNYTFTRNQEFYDKLFKLAKEYNFGFHPMVSAVSIDKWIDNYKWWCEQFKRYKLKVDGLMMLEVRNDDWTDDKIQKLLEFLDYVIEYKYNVLFDKDKIEMCYDVFKIKEKGSYNNIALVPASNRYNCRIQHSFYVRLGDLAITPCHRTSYDNLIFGKLVVKDGKIVDIEANNVELAIKLISGNPKYIQHECSSCEYNDFCSKGCLGAQLENNGELFIPCKSVCEMTKKKVDFLVNRYNDMGLFKVLETINVDNNNKSKIKRGLEFMKFIG